MEKVVIIGSGPAGLTAALYAARANLEPLLFEGLQPGGQLTITNDVENFPGFPEGKTGPEIIELMRAQAERFGARIERDSISSVDLSQRPFRLRTAEGKEIVTQSVIVASGASARWLGIESEKALQGKGVSACATCDGFFFRGKEVAVVGGGDSAIEEATFLTRFCTKVSLIHRRDELRASKIMRKRAMDNEKVDIVWDSVVDEVLGVEAGKVTGLLLRNVKTGETSEFPCDGLFLGIGHDPNTTFLAGALETDSAGFIICKNGTTATSVEGVFASGDVMDPRYKQAVTAAGTGCMSAIDAEKFLEEKGLG